ncbi:2650_t:CDS:2 [Paraglomus brasilianum]|uniref:2650_t:CDS:1 n=1 Tax=Paraglomus brasilianum TaxID=144538 RepID=A0A9N8ZF59_9GLOM|nr:2650_t:CDS:2 [Paraglomus brasilianum]
MADSTWDSVRWLQSPQNYCRHLIENARNYQINQRLEEEGGGAEQGRQGPSNHNDQQWSENLLVR